MAELWGLREGLKLARYKHIDRIIIEMDSEATIKLMVGDTEEEDIQGAIIKDYKIFASKFERIKYTHTWREVNKCADWLANLGQLGDWGTTILEEPPDGLFQLLYEDARGAMTRKVTHW